MPIAHLDVMAAAIAVRDEMLDSDRYETVAAINSGACEEFASDVIERLGGCQAAHAAGIEMVDVAGFIQIDPETGFSFDSGGPFDRDLLATHYPAVSPPQGLDWDDLDAISAKAGFDAGTHVFLAFERLFYDAESPEGVDNLFDLPFFQRVIDNWRDARVPGP